MTGICGWLRRPSSVRPEAPIAAMAESLFGAAPTRYLALGSRAMLGGRVAGSELAVDASKGLAAAIEGKPRWTDAGLAAIAAERGHARALLEAFARDPRGFLRSLSGTFALALADDKAGELVLAVDRMGIRPLCYALNAAGDCVFGSNASAVVAEGHVDTAFAPQSIYDYVYFHVIPSPATVYAGVRKLEPGQLCRYADGKISLEYYWTPAVVAERSADPRELQAALMAEMRAAIARTSPGASTGAFLSGGLDSSTVCGLANEKVHPLRSFTIGFSDERYNETEYARAAAEQFGLDLREYYVTPDDIADAFELVATSYDEPFGNSSALPAYFCALRAKEAGVSRMLAGDGGDELFAGNERYATQQLFEYYHGVPSAVRRGAEPLLLALPSWTKLTHKARRYVEQARVPMPERLQTYNYLHMNAPRDVFDGAFLANVDTRHPVEQMNLWYGRHRDANFVDRMLRFDWKLTLADNDLRKVNRMCTAAGVEVDYPLLDDSLVEFSLRIPAAMKMENRELRSFYKQAVAGFLPAKIIHKKKHGFGLPFGVWLATSPRLQQIVSNSMASFRQRGIMRPEAIDELLRAHRVDHGAYYGNIIWVLTALESWLRAHDARMARRAA